MAVLNKEFIEFDKKIKLTEKKIYDLKKSRKGLRDQIRKWFKDEKPEELQPKFHGQGSQLMNTSINPLSRIENGNKIFPYDSDDGIYFIEKKGEDNKRSINEWQEWVYKAVENYTSKKPEKRNACIRVTFSDGHHFDFPIYYKKNGDIQLAHKIDGWTDADAKAFYEWYNDKKNKQIERNTRIAKAWKDYQENENDGLELLSGFELSILIVENYVEEDNLDDSFRLTMKAILEELEKPDHFKCIRPTTPEGENLFENYSSERKNNFLNYLRSLVEDCKKAKEECNYRKASEILRDNQFGDRFPLGEDRDEEEKSNKIEKCLVGAVVNPKPYAN